MAIKLIVFFIFTLINLNDSTFDFMFNNSPFKSILNNFQSFGNEFNPVFDANKNFKNPIAEESEFNPSVVIVDTKPEVPSFQRPISPHLPIIPIFQQPTIWQNWFPIRKVIPWWKGENICIERKVIDETNESNVNDTFNPNESSKNGLEITISGGASNFIFSSQFTSCVDDESAHICTTRLRNSKQNKTTIVRHECCHGYRRNVNGLPGCLPFELKSVVDTLMEIGSKQFSDLFSANELTERKIKSNENVTVFSPVDQSMVSMVNMKENEIQVTQQKTQKLDEIADNDKVPSPESELTTTEETLSSSSSSSPSTTTTTPSSASSSEATSPEENSPGAEMVNRHVVNGLYKLHDLGDNELLTTLNENEKLRVNVYNNMRKVITVNCVPILSGDNPSVNGIVHSVERPLPSANKTLGQLLESDQRFTKFTQFLKDGEIFEKLNDLDGTYTIFAPTNEVFESASQRVQSPCFANVLKNHLVNNIYCSPGIFGEQMATTLNSMQLLLRRTYDYKLYAQNALVTDKDHIAANGVLHAVDSFIYSESYEPLSKSIDLPIAREFFKLLNQTNLLNEFDQKQDVTFLVPTNEALKRLPKDKKELLANDTEAILRYHLTQPRLNSKNFYNNELLVSSVGKSVRINLYGDFPNSGNRITAQCANIIMEDRDTCHGVVHFVDRVLFPSKDSIVELIDSMNGNYEVFKGLLQTSNFVEKFSKENGPYTLLLPDDKAFKRTFNEKELNDYLNDTNKATKIVQRHFIPEFICCSGFNQMPFLFSVQQFRTLDGSTISAAREFNGKIRVGTAEIRKCDQLANNGVVHLIDRVIYPKTNYHQMLPANSIFNLFLN